MVSQYGLDDFKAEQKMEFFLFVLTNELIFNSIVVLFCFSFKNFYKLNEILFSLFSLESHILERC